MEGDGVYVVDVYLICFALLCCDLLYLLLVLTADRSVSNMRLLWFFLVRSSNMKL